MLWQEKKKKKHIISTGIEHHAVLHTCGYLEKRGFEFTYINVDENGILKLLIPKVEQKLEEENKFIAIEG